VNIALDFDDTYTRDPEMWDNIIDIFQKRGHDVRIVTFRKKSMNEPALDYLKQKMPVIFTEYQQKRTFTNNMNWFVDVWIDDSPEFINEPLLLL
jgi:CO dehydrogenase/acetyl-CoA synthase gamma subunit (corrinoid Fe-S protein)